MLADSTFVMYPFLEKISLDSRRAIEKNSKSYFFKNKSNIIFKGDKVGGAYLVESGCLRVYNIDAKGKEITLYTVLPGESCLLALNCVFSDLRYPAWVDVDSPLTKVLMIPSGIYRQLYVKENAIRDFTFNILSARIFDLMSTLEETTSCELDYRLASFLIRRSDNSGIVYISHQDIASHLGTAREVVSRLLKQFEKNGLLKTARGCITLTDIKKLASYCS